MDMTTPETPPIACTLAPGDYLARLAWIAKLARDGLRSAERRDLVLELHYALETADRVREMVRRERACCAFLTFDLQETSEEIQLIIRAPEEARGTLDMLFEQFSPSAAMKKSEKAARTVAVVSANDRRRGCRCCRCLGMGVVGKRTVTSQARNLDALPDGARHGVIGGGAPVAGDRAGAQDPEQAVRR
jgi:hypothetical protein